MRTANIAVSLLLILAGMVWLGLISIAPDMQSDLFLGHGIACALTTVGLIALWTLLAGAVLIAGVANRADLVSGIFVGLLLLGSVAGSLAAVRVCAGTVAPAWMLIIVFAPPPIVACLAIAIQSPKVRRSAPAVVVNGLWCALIALVLVPCPFIAREARLQSEVSLRIQTVSERAAVRHLPVRPRDAASAMVLAADHNLQRH